MVSPQETRRIKRSLAETAVSSTNVRDKFIETFSHLIARNLQQVPPRYSWERPEGITVISDQLFGLMRFGANPELFDRYQKQRRNLYHLLLKEMREDQSSNLLLDFHRDVFQEGRFEDEPMAIKAALADEFTCLYLSLCKKNEFLAGLKGGLFWQPYSSENVETERELVKVESATTSQVCQLVPFIGENELELVPKRFILSADFENLDIPEPAKSIEDLLYEAYIKQRYLVPPEGALVRFRKAGDVEEVLVRQVGDVVLGKFSTPKGEFLAGINLDTARHWPLFLEYPEIQTFCEILAEVYRDLVIAVELPAREWKRRYTRRKDIVPSEEELLSEWIIIPRRVYIYPEEEWRLPLGERRPAMPHRVRGHFRKGNITDKQLARVREFEQRIGIHILANLPEGSTFVHPHVSPRGTEDKIAKYPRFIKRRIEKELVESFRQRVAR